MAAHPTPAPGCTGPKDPCSLGLRSALQPPGAPKGKQLHAGPAPTPRKSTRPPLLLGTLTKPTEHTHLLHAPCAPPLHSATERPCAHLTARETTAPRGETICPMLGGRGRSHPGPPGGSLGLLLLHGPSKLLGCAVHAVVRALLAFRPSPSPSHGSTVPRGRAHGLGHLQGSGPRAPHLRPHLRPPLR